MAVRRTRPDVRGHVACEIASATRLEPHWLTSFARVDGETITYP
jgi:hypothetical protein